jgi:predicted Fe-Mo cluster-binding NifX family protein
MKRVAIPVEKGKLSSYFGQCNHYELFDVEGKEITRNRVEVPRVQQVEDLPGWAAQQGITDVIAHRVSKQIVSLFSEYKINLYLGIKSDDPEKLIGMYVAGNLQSDMNIIKEITSN